MDHSAEGIRVNGICPGWIETPMNANYFAMGPHVREQAAKLLGIGERTLYRKIKEYGLG